VTSDFDRDLRDGARLFMQEMSPHATHDELASYVLGAMDEPEVRAVERHLARCSECLAKVLLLERVNEAAPLPADIPPEVSADPAGRVLAFVVRQVRRLGTTPVAQGVPLAAGAARDEPRGRSEKHEEGGSLLHLELTPDDRVRVTVTRDDEPAAGASVTLERLSLSGEASETVASATTDAAGAADLGTTDDLPKASPDRPYRLSVRLPD
jgi:hypothetical protein